MNFEIKTVNLNECLFIYCDHSSKEQEYIQYFLATQNLQMENILFEKDNGVFYISKYKAKDNRKFLRLLFLLQKEINFKINNPHNDVWIVALLNSFEKYKVNVQKQELLYQGIMNQTLNLVEINVSQFKWEFQPKKFQIQHTQFALTNQRSANFSSPGSGKTIVAYMVALSLFANQEINTLMVVGPKSASSVWSEEWKTVTNKNSIYVSSDLNFSHNKKNHIKKINFTSFATDKLNLVFVNFHKFQDNDFAEKIFKIFSKRKTFLIVDEAHYIKNRKGLRHQNLSRLSTAVDYTMLLTGTPLPRFSAEGAYISEFLFPDISREGLEYKDFQSSSELTKLGSFVNSCSKNKLITKFKKIFIRKNKQQLVNERFLKPMLLKKINIEINDCEKFIMTKLRILGYANILDEKVIDNMNQALIIRRMQASSYPPLLRKPLMETASELISDVYEEDDPKEIKSELKFSSEELSLDKDIAKIIAGSQMSSLIDSYLKGQTILMRWQQAVTIINAQKNKRVVVWDVFKKSMVAFKEYLESITKDRVIFLINGDIKMIEREQIITKFKNITNAILIVSPATVAESISLHKHVHTAIYLYKNYVGSHFMQSKDRIHRLVGKDEVTFDKNIYLIEAEEPSIDQMISKNLEEKEKQQQEFID